MGEPCLSAVLWAKAVAAGHDLTTAQGRTAFDRLLRDELTKIADPQLRGHTADLLRERRRRAFGGHGQEDLVALLERVDTYLNKSGARQREALRWYAEQVRDCRVLGAVGDMARAKLDRDGGHKARVALGIDCKESSTLPEKHVTKRAREHK